MKTDKSISDVMILTKKGNKITDKIVFALTKEARVVAIGNEALTDNILNNPNIVIASPFFKGFISDFTIAQKYFRFMLKKANLPKLRAIKVCLVVPDGYSPIERKAIIEVMYDSCKLKEIIFAEQGKVNISYEDMLEATKSDVLIRIWMDDDKELMEDFEAIIKFHAADRGAMVKFDYQQIKAD